MVRLIIPLMLFPALSACAGQISPASLSRVQAAADQIVIQSTRGLILAHLSYQSVATPIAIAIEQGLITGGTKARLQALDQAVVGALRSAGNVQSQADQARHVASAMASIAEMARLAGVPLPKF